MHATALRLMPMGVGLLMTLTSAALHAQEGEGMRVPIQSHVLKAMK
jgi:hypothetical protein